MPYLTELLTGFSLGLLHAFDADHVAALTHFVSVDPRPRRGAAFGFRWGIGHTVTVFLVASALILLTGQVQEGGALERTAELIVGLSLIGLGLWRLWVLLRRPHTHRHTHGGIEHEHPHTHIPGSGHVHAHAPTALGLLHGAAGTAGVFALIPASIIPSKPMAFVYILLFCAGTTLAMSAYGFLAGYLYRQTGWRWQQGFRVLVAATALVGITLGMVWISNSLS